MHKIGLVMAALLCCTITYGQYNIAIKVSDADNKQPLAGATISIIALQKNTTADSAGTGQFKNLAAGKYSVLISFIGYAEKYVPISIPFTKDVLEVLLDAAKEEEKEEEGVIVQSTRTRRNIKNVPTRVETIELEEIDEKSNMRPANVSKLLHESTGMEV